MATAEVEKTHIESKNYKIEVIPSRIHIFCAMSKFFDLKNDIETAQYACVTVPIFKRIDDLCIKFVENKFMYVSRDVTVTQMENLCNADYIGFIPNMGQSFLLREKAPSSA